MIRRMSRLATAMLLTILLAAASDGAHAHAVLVESTPVDGAVLDRAPDRVMLRFNEPVRVISLRLVDEGGQVTPLAQGPQSTPDQVEAPLPSLSPGSYVVSWRASVCGWAPRRRLGLLHARDGAAPCRPGRDGAGGRDAGGAPHGAPGRPGLDLRRRAPGGGPRPLSRPVRAARGRGPPGRRTAGSRGRAARCRCDRNRRGRPISDAGGRARGRAESNDARQSSRNGIRSRRPGALGRSHRPSGRAGPAQLRPHAGRRGRARGRGVIRVHRPHGAARIRRCSRRCSSSTFLQLPSGRGRSFP